jgi:beta-alanine degradation protein BauB
MEILCGVCCVRAAKRVAFRRMHITRGLVVFATLALSSMIFAEAEPSLDPAVVNAKTIKVTLDNPQVRVFEAVLAPGQKEALHSHPRTVVYVIEGGRMRNHPQNGSSAEVDLIAGQTLYREPTIHWAENIGTTTMRLVVVEMKEPAAH